MMRCFKVLNQCYLKSSPGKRSEKMPCLDDDQMKSAISSGVSFMPFIIQEIMTALQPALQ